MSTNLPNLIAVVGPTASGKTDIALAIAQKFSGEIIVADSRQIYRGVNISSNKTPGEIIDGQFCVDRIPYHGLNLVEPDDILTVSQWKQTTLATITSILERGHLPILEGGTGLYASAILDNYNFADAPPDPSIRKRIKEQIERDGLKRVADELLRRDPGSAEFLDIENPRRVTRALEVIEITNKPYSEQRGKRPKIFNDLRLGIKRDMEDIDARIEERAAEQFEKGLEEEARDMLNRFGPNLPAMTSIGYIEWRDYFDGTATKGKVLERNIQRNKKFARAQMKWLNRDKHIRWITSIEEAISLVQQHLA